MKILAIDYGSKRIGLAISDETQTLARENGIYSPQQFWVVIEEICKDQELERILIGLPLNMSGQATEKTGQVRNFARELQKKVGVPIEFADERLSSQMAETISGSSQNIDSLAAQIFLQNYLNSRD